MKWLITGVRTGLGKAMAEAALGRGDTVFGIVRGEQAAQSFEAIAPGRSFAAIADITDRKAVFKAVATAERLTGGLDVVVNNAANQLESYIEEAEPDEIRKIIESNIIGHINTIQASLPYFRARARGHFINISSLGGIIGVPWVAFYSMTKFAMEGLSEALQREVGPLGISVTIVEPGGFRTEFFSRPHFCKEPAIADYERSAGHVRSHIQSAGGKENGDPRKFAAVILKVADAKDPPQRIAVGDDAIATVLAKATLLKTQVDAWRDVCSNLDFDNEPSSEQIVSFDQIVT
jgi:NAD(P)-dependent dehydrogenase (short-subunit alcohol dehydrogenase family)